MSESRIQVTLENIESSVIQFLHISNGCKQFAFYGNMGAGKTTFITALCKQLKAIDLVSSPTFSIVNEYETELSEIIYHFDFYRIKEPEELFDIGFEEYITDTNWCFIEWPEMAEELIPDTFKKVRIEVNDDGERCLVF